MILFDTMYYDIPKLRKFEGVRRETTNDRRITKSFSKAKQMVLKAIDARISELEALKKSVEGIESEEDLDFSPNPYTGYLRSKHGDLKKNY